MLDFEARCRQIAHNAEHDNSKKFFGHFSQQTVGQQGETDIITKLQWR